jgi:cytoskeletal protein RodZ
MQSVGQILLAARLASGRTMEDVSAKTRITLKNLKAIEEDEFSIVSSRFFYKSFVRQYAEELDLSYSQIAEAVKAAADTMPRPLMPGEGETPLPRVGGMRTAKRGKLRWLHSLASLVVMLVACSTVYAMWQNSRSHLQASITSFVTSLKQNTHPEKLSRSAVSAQPQPISLVKISLVKTNTVNPDTQKRPAAETLEDANSSPHIQLSALEPTWLSIMADGKQDFVGILDPAEIKVLGAHDNVRIRTGNAGGVNVVFNGKSLGALGARGQVRTVVFTKDSYEVVEPAAHMTLTQFTPSGG